MTALLLAIIGVLCFFSSYLLFTLKKKIDRIEGLTHQELALRSMLEKSKKEYEDLQQKFQKNPSYECQQLLAQLLSGHALFHIETIDPENIFIRRR